MLEKASDASGVNYRHLDNKDRTVFNSARKFELDNLMELGAYRILSLEESRALQKAHGRKRSAAQIGGEVGANRRWES